NRCCAWTSCRKCRDCMWPPSPHAARTWCGAMRRCRVSAGPARGDEMARKSTIKSKPTEWRRHFDKLIREDRWTLDEILDQMCEQFPDEKTPSRSAAGRYSKKVKDLGARMREIEAAGTALVKDL